MLLAGVAGTLCAGPLADRLGRRLVLLASMLLTPGLIVLYVELGGVIGAIAVCAAGAVIVSTFGVTIVLAQEYLPSRIAMASGMSVGLASGLGGIAAVALGAIADAIDLRTALLLMASGPSRVWRHAPPAGRSRPVRARPRSRPSTDARPPCSRSSRPRRTSSASPSSCAPTSATA